MCAWVLRQQEWKQKHRWYCSTSFLLEGSLCLEKVGIQHRCYKAVSFKRICSGSSREKHNFTFTWDIGFWLMGFSWLWWCFVSGDFSSCRRLATCCRECTAVTGWNSPSNLVKVKQPDQMIFAKISFLLFFDLGKGSNNHSDFKPFLVFSSYLALATGSV